MKNAPPSAEYSLGCDQMGRCELSRLIYGARYSLGLSIPVLWPKRSFGSDNNDYGGLHSTGTGIFQCHSPAFGNNFYVYDYSDWTFGHGLENGTLHRASGSCSALVVFAAKKAQSNAENANMDAKRAAYDGVQEYLDTIQELKSCSREDEYLEGLEKKLDNVVQCSFRNEIAPGAATTTAQFILFLLFAGRIYEPFTSCFMLMAEVFSALVSVKRMKLIDATPEQTGTNICNNKGYDIEFRDVVFSYNEEPILKGVSFVAKQGEVTALVGPSGSGKSTVSKLAARFWDADSGTITLGGVDVKTVEPETLFKNYAIVFVWLDEATASMDAESETLVQDVLSVLLKDKTVMVIAHRMRTVGRINTLL